MSDATGEGALMFLWDTVVGLAFYGMVALCSLLGFVLLRVLVTKGITPLLVMLYLRRAMLGSKCGNIILIALLLLLLLWASNFMGRYLREERTTGPPAERVHDHHNHP